MARLTPLRPNRGGAFERWTVRLLLPALVAALLLAVAGLFGFRTGDLTALWDGPERGDWLAIRINGQAVGGHSYIVRFEHGDIVGGHDGCNAWGFSDTIDPRTGKRLISSDAQACAEGPVDHAYWSLVSGPTHFTLRDDGLLEIRNEGDARLSPIGYFARLEDVRGAVDWPVNESQPGAIDPDAPPPPPPVGADAPPPPPMHPKPPPPPGG